MPRDIDRPEVRRLRDERAQQVEVLPAREYQRRIAAATNLPLKDLGPTAGERLDPARAVITRCPVGIQARQRNFREMTQQPGLAGVGRRCGVVASGGPSDRPDHGGPRCWSPE